MIQKDEPETETEFLFRLAEVVRARHKPCWPGWPVYRTVHGPVRAVPFNEAAIIYQFRLVGETNFRQWLCHWRPDIGDLWDAAVANAILGDK